MSRFTSSLRLSALALALAARVLAANAFGEEEEKPVVAIDVSVVQPKAGSDAAPTDKSGADQHATKPQRLTTSNNGVAVYIAPVGQSIELAGRVLHVADPAEDRDARNVRDKRNWAWTQIVGPRIICFVQQAASCQVGRTEIPYMKQREDGSLIVDYWTETEGLSIDVNASAADAAGVTLEQLAVKITRLVGREPIPGVPFDVGRPIIRTMSVSTAMRLAPDKTAIIEMPTVAEDEKPVFVLIQARLAEPDSESPAALSGQSSSEAPPECRIE